MCSNCMDNLRRNAAKLRVPRPNPLLPGPRPTAEGLEKHAARFGPAQVAETAAEYGLSVVIVGEEPRRPRRRRRR